MRKRTVYALILTGAVMILLLVAVLVARRMREPDILPTPMPTSTPTPTAAPTPTATPEPTAMPAPLVSQRFELPLEGATGYTSISMNLRERASSSARLLETLEAGTAFRIVSESGAWWEVETEGARGWLASKYCMVNLPDIVPSIVYNATNTYSSLLRSSGKALPGITGKRLYAGKAYNARFGQQEFIMPVLYAMAEKVYAAQKSALVRGETLVLYEAYRPYDAQMEVVRALTKLADSDRAVMKGISTEPWALSWFASTKLSNHQRGGAIDVSLAKVLNTETARAGAYGYTNVTKYEPYTMPTAMHELSAAAAAFTGPVSGASPTAWKRATLASSMNAPAKRLQGYLTRAGLTPLASEWWHFNDLDALKAASGNPGRGRFTLTVCMSKEP